MISSQWNQPAGQVLLNNKEFQLMEYFMMNSNQKWPINRFDYGKSLGTRLRCCNVVWVNISSLRKISSIDANVAIKSARGLGYQLMVEA